MPAASPSPAASTASAETTQFTNSLSLAAVPTAVSAARRYVRDELTRAGLGVLIDDAELVASELVTNAVQATGLTHGDLTWPELERVPVIRIRLGFGVSTIFIEVWDQSNTFPAVLEASADEEGGRGLLIVESLCTRWSARNDPGGGKVVCAELSIPVSIKLPRRAPRRSH